jgi:ribosomal protein S18 acetylase RimI-like enzyme
MISNGIIQWTYDYPDKGVIRKDMQNEHLWIHETGSIVNGTVTINSFEHPAYSQVNWQHSNFQVIHRLAVDPGFQRKGIAKKLMLHAENYCLERGYESIRLDAFTQNSGNLRFYNDLNYRQVGQIHFNSHQEPFACFEKLL